MEKIKNYLKGLMYEPEGPSLTRFITLVMVMLFALVTLLLIAMRYDWPGYPVFAGVTGGGGVGGIVGNKFLNNKYRPSEAGKEG